MERSRDWLDTTYALIRKTLDVAGLEPHVYTWDEAARMHSTVERMERNGIILFTAPETPARP